MPDIEKMKQSCKDELDRLWKHYDESKKAKLNIEAQATLGKIVGIEWALDTVLDNGY